MFVFFVPNLERTSMLAHHLFKVSLQIPLTLDLRREKPIKRAGNEPTSCCSTSSSVSFIVSLFSLLGDTIEKIAWQKAGIMKKGRPTFVDPNQPQVTLKDFK